MDESIETNLPGRPKMPAAVSERVAAALAAKGSSYVPRTHHQDNGKAHFTNRLILETSPYLLQHAHNPVNWFPWGNEAFELAQAQGKPVFLSIGYSTCHWCHVMEEESFEDEEIAAYLNENYVCIKVDREERPDVDAVYMSAVQNLTGGGGWPMSVWLTPERHPFFGGTYFPPRDGVRGVRRGFLSLTKELAETFIQRPEEITKAAHSLVAVVKEDMEGGLRAKQLGVPPLRVIDDTLTFYKRAFDTVHGGVRRAPKFPSHMPVRLLLRQHQRTGDSHTLHMAAMTLEKMAAGGMYDQIAGGFHRYSTDAQWLVPHFEKMLYDNALLTVAYAEAYQKTARPVFARVVREVLDYVIREMTNAEGGFYSATDADSEGEEGTFFVWSLEEVESLLGAEAAPFIAHYGITQNGNFEGRNIPHVQHPNEEVWAKLASARATLYQARAKRVPPVRDEKVLAAWNGLMLSAMAVGGQVLGEAKYIDAAARAAHFLLNNLKPQDRMVRSHKDGRAQTAGFLEDQVFVTAGLLDLFEATSQPQWLRQALALAEATEAHFADVEHGGWFMTAHDAEKLLARERPTNDGAEPSGTSVAIMNALRLFTFTDDSRWQAVAERGLSSVAHIMEKSGMSLTEGLLALDRYWDKPKQIVIVWPTGMRAAAEPLLEVFRSCFVPNRALVAVEAGAALGEVESLVGFVAGKTAENGKPVAYVCEHGQCDLPTSDPAQFRSQLQPLPKPV